MSDDIDFLLLKQSLAEWISFLKEICGDRGGGVKYSYSTFTFQSFNSLYLVVPSFLKFILDHCLFPDEI